VPKESITAILLLSCPDRKGLVSRISNFIFERGGNIVDLDEHVNDSEQRFFLRVAWDMSGFSVPPEQVHSAFRPMGEEFQADWSIRLNSSRHRLAIFVSKYDHCLQEILWRHDMKEYDAEIALIISNHPELAHLAERYRVPFRVFPVTAETKSSVEKAELELLRKEGVDTIILARYMQVLSPEFVREYPNRIINIHHSFLPAFAGRNPYGQAYDRGVKIVGATSHYVTEVLDDGPIIEQEVVHITHKDSVDDLIRKGRDLERLVLARALRLHMQDRILVHGRKTVIFE